MGKRIAISLFIAVCAIPLTAGLGYSLLYSFGVIGVLNEGFTLQNWCQVFRGEFIRSIGYSSYIATASTFFSAGIAFLFLAIGKTYWLGKYAYRSLFLPLTIPPIVSAFVIFQLYSGSGLLSRLTYHSGFISGTSGFPNMVQDPWAIGIIITHIFLVFPFFLLLLLNLYQNEKLDELEATAKTLGAGSLQIIFHIQLPILLRRMFPILALYFIFFLGAYEIPLILGQSSPQMISVLIVEKLQRFNLADIPVAHAMVVWYSLICLATITLLFYEYKKRFQL